jgi:hypothetical protein
LASMRSGRFGVDAGDTLAIDKATDQLVAELP